MHKTEKDTRICCNQCGRELKMEQGIVKEGVCTVEVDWGYFSSRDGESHRFHLCEACYNHLIQQFRIPVQVRQRTELL